MSRRGHSKTEIWSIFGQIDSVVAEEMIREGKAVKIPQDQIPASARYNDKDEIARFAVVIKTEYAAEYDRRVRDLYA